MAGGNYQVTQEIIHSLGPLTNMRQVGREGQRHAAVNRTQTRLQEAPGKNIF